MRKTTGISLLLLIFLTLTLITFSLLSYSGSQADARLCQKAADHTTSYYQMTGKSNEVLAFIDAQLLQLTAVSEICTFVHSNSAFSEQLSTEFPDIHFSFEEEDTIPSISFNVSADSDTGQALHVTLTFEQPKSDSDPLYQITSWKVINTQDWTPDQSQKLLRIQ